MEEAGFNITPPDWWDRKGARLAVRLRLEPENNDIQPHITTGKMGLDQLVRFTWELSLGGERISRDEFERLTALRSPLVQIRGQWVQLETTQLEAASKFWSRQQQTGSMNLVQAALYSLGREEASEGLPVDEVVVDGWVREWLQQLEDQGRLDHAGTAGRFAGYAASVSAPGLFLADILPKLWYGRLSGG